MVMVNKYGQMVLYMKDNGKMINLMDKYLYNTIKGKLIHADGDIYEGEWMEDAACG